MYRRRDRIKVNDAPVDVSGLLNVLYMIEESVWKRVRKDHGTCKCLLASLLT